MKAKDDSIKNKQPWPTKDAMKQIYEMRLWGGAADYYSGEGSHHPTLVAPYVEAVSSFLATFERPITVCDLGCGDFNVGKELVQYTKKYIAVDIVQELVARNKEKFKAENLVFQCLDIAENDLPIADCAIVRQVLQHLSNAEIQRIASKFSNYSYVIVTEHLPEGDFIPNVDIISGQGIRLKKKSGVNLLAPPFNLKVKQVEELMSIAAIDGNGIVLTTMYYFN